VDPRASRTLTTGSRKGRSPPTTRSRWSRSTSGSWPGGASRSTSWPCSAPACSWAWSRSPSSGPFLCRTTRRTCRRPIRTSARQHDPARLQRLPAAHARTPARHDRQPALDLLTSSSTAPGSRCSSASARPSSRRSSARSSAASPATSAAGSTTILMRIVDVMLSIRSCSSSSSSPRSFGQRRLAGHPARLRRLRLAGHRPAGPQPLPDAPHRGLRRRGAGRRRQRPPDHLPAHPAERRQPDHRLHDALVAGVIIGEAFVSFLGYGVDPAKTPTWGNILTNGPGLHRQGNWWWALFPGLAIVLTVLGINFMGDGLRDALDPRSRE
jgi:hypothetical protein